MRAVDGAEVVIGGCIVVGTAVVVAVRVATRKSAVVVMEVAVVKRESTSVHMKLFDT